MATIIFDMDGTIADSFDYVVDFLAYTKFGRPLTHEQKKQYYGMSMIGMARAMGFSWFSLPGLLLRGRRRMKKSMKDVKPFTGLPEVIKKLHNEGHELFIVSSNSVKNIRRFLHQYHLHMYFLQIYGGISLFGKAPALRKLFRDQNLEIVNGVYVGDELRDIQAAKSIKLKVVAVTWGFANPKTLQSMHPNKLVHSPAELLAALEEI